ncbi:MAG: type B 50S ribosomal protein L31 [Planctomycetota bacterium]|nr:MAG: type B 50S ribosomal protein L31 [Planctomycetota bacterium]
MKAEIHPEVRPVIFQDSVNGCMYRIDSAVESRETITIEGQEYPLVKVDVTSSSHPFYTGNQRIMDTAGRVEKFGSKFGANLSRLAKKKGKA